MSTDNETVQDSPETTIIAVRESSSVSQLSSNNDSSVDGSECDELVGSTEEDEEVEVEESEARFLLPTTPLGRGFRRKRPPPEATSKKKYDVPIYFKNVIVRPVHEPINESLLKRQYETVGDSESEDVTEWEEYMDQLWDVFKEKQQEKWRKHVKYKAEYVDEVYTASDASANTLREKLAKKKRKRKKLLMRDPDGDYRLNTNWKCELRAKEDAKTKSDIDLSPKNSSTTLSVSSMDSDGLSKIKYLSPAKIINRSEELVNRLFNYKNVDGVIILIDEKVAATTIRDDVLVSYLINRFYYTLINEYKLFRDLDPDDPLVSITFDTRLYYLICGLGYGGTKHESFAIMVFQSVDKEDLQIRAIHPPLPLRDKCTFPKVWISGIESTPITSSELHLAKFRTATGLGPLKVKKYTKTIQPLIRTGKHTTSADWRMPLQLTWTDTSKKNDVIVNSKRRKPHLRYRTITTKCPK